jgi:ABC-type branched-subunit amino acid transport system permease subunit
LTIPAAPPRGPRPAAAWWLLAVPALGAPWLVAWLVPGQQRYVLHVLIYTALFAALALSYDLVVGHVGSLSLAHPAFFGVGAYAAAILSTEAGWPFPAGLAAAVLLAGAVAVLAGVPLFRLTEHAFAVGTLGFALVAWIVATNWVEVTRGPLCITGIPKPGLPLPGGATLVIATLPAYYWLALASLAGVLLLYRGLTTFRLGRAFHAVRDNEPLAAAAGIDPLRYRMLAFVVGGALAGGVGALYAHYLSVMCPEEMTIALTVNLLVIVFLGGVGTLRGVLVGAALFTALPEVLRLAPTWRLVIYGALLLVIVIRSPGGLEALMRRGASAR